MYNNYYDNELKCCNCECPADDASDCHEYKEKSNELYAKAHAIKEQSRILICEADAYRQEAKALEFKSRELCANAIIIFDQARQIESEIINLLDLSSFYCDKVSDCYKNISNSSCSYTSEDQSSCRCK